MAYGRWEATKTFLLMTTKKAEPTGRGAAATQLHWAPKGPLGAVRSRLAMLLQAAACVETR